MKKNKPLLSLGRREYEVLKFIHTYQPVRRKVISDSLNLQGGQIFFNKLNLLGLIEKDRQGSSTFYLLNANGKWFVEYIQNSPKLLERLHD